MTVVVPTGLPLAEAARWVGGSCWLELHAHAVITEVMAGDLADDVRVELWRVRANRAATAEEWHRRLPELREMPRSDFVSPPPSHESTSVATVAGGPGVEGVLALIDDLDRRYADHETVAVGPADGPVSTTLSLARVLLARDRSALTR